MNNLWGRKLNILYHIPQTPFVRLCLSWLDRGSMLLCMKQLDVKMLIPQLINKPLTIISPLSWQQPWEISVALMQWILSHCGIEGNEQAERIANLGEEGRKNKKRSVWQRWRLSWRLCIDQPEPPDSYNYLSRSDQGIIWWRRLCKKGWRLSGERWRASSVLQPFFTRQRLGRPTSRPFSHLVCRFPTDLSSSPVHETNTTLPTTHGNDGIERQMTFYFISNLFCLNSKDYFIIFVPIKIDSFLRFNHSLIALSLYNKRWN